MRLVLALLTLSVASSFDGDEASLASLPTAVRVKLRDEALTSCFAHAYSAVDSPADCSVLTEREKRQFSLALTDCHLEDAGRPRACPVAGAETAHAPLDCLATTSAEAFAVFTQYTLHIDALCFFAQSRLHVRRAEALSVALNATQTRALEVGVALLQSSNETRSTLDTLLAEHTLAMNNSLVSAHKISSALDRVTNISEAALLLSTSSYLSSRAILVDVIYASAAIAAVFLTGGRIAVRARVPVLIAIVTACALEHAVDANVANETTRVGRVYVPTSGWVSWALVGLSSLFRGIATVLLGGESCEAAAVRARSMIRFAAFTFSLTILIRAYAFAPQSLEQVVGNLSTRFDRMFPDVQPAAESSDSEWNSDGSDASDPHEEASPPKTSKALRKTRAAVANPLVQWESARNFAQFVRQSAFNARHELDSLQRFSPPPPPDGDAAADGEPLADAWSTSDEGEESGSDETTAAA